MGGFMVRRELRVSFEIMPDNHYIIDAFVTDAPFSGNPAAVCLLDDWPDDALLTGIAAENNLSETAFCVRRGSNDYLLRWFTPSIEVDLCGHATLATAHVLITERTEASGEELRFETRSGTLEVAAINGGYSLDLPLRPIDALVGTDSSELPGELIDALGIDLVDVEAAIISRGVVAVIVKGAAVVVDTQPDFDWLARAQDDMTIVTAATGLAGEYAARVFAPALGIREDPATGAAQCLIGPYWAMRLNSSEVVCKQMSSRGARLDVSVPAGGERVLVSGRCRTVVRGRYQL